jgi:hypothetical protein
MNELLEKARQMYPIGTKFKQLYPIGTKFRGMYGRGECVVTKNLFTRCGNIYTYDDKFEWITIYDLVQNRWAEIIKEQETIPLKILNNKAEDIFQISKNGDIVLRGKVIVNDIELSEILTNLNNKK